MTNRGQKNENDNWLTPPKLVELLGPFDTDPCCPPLMPWRTAKKMISNGELTGWEKKLKGKKDTVKPWFANGLEAPWLGEVFLNNPFSKPYPWMERMVAHRKGVVLAPAKSMETKWAQLLLSSSDVTLFLDDRISFCYPDGTQSSGSWSGYMLCGFGKKGVAAVTRASKVHEYRGVLMRCV